MLSMTLCTSCDETIDEPQPTGKPTIANISEISNAYFADSLRISATVDDADGVALSTLKVYILFGDETVAEQTIRTRTAGTEYTATLYVPFVANIPDGNATLGLSLENITGAKTTQELTLRVSRPEFEYITFVCDNGNEYKLTPEGNHTYSVTNNFERKMTGFIQTPAYGNNGNQLTFGMSGSQIALGATKPITFSNTSAGEYKICFNTLTFEGAPFETVSNLADFDNNIAETYLEQGQTIAFSGIDTNNYWFDPDFFTQEKDGSYTFNAISGTYRLIADDKLAYIRIYPINNDEPATLNADGSGALWIIGAGVGKPTVKNNEVGWTTEKAISLAQISEKIYQATFIAGRSINAENINFKFFGQMGWGIELTSDKLTSTSDIVLVGDGTNSHDNGNLYLADGKTLDANGIYTFTVDLTAGSENAILSVEKTGEITIETESVTANGTEMQTTDNVEFSATLTLTQNADILFNGIDDIDTYWVNPDAFSGTASALKLSAVSGEYKIIVNKENRTITAQSTSNKLTDEEHGTIWILGNGVGSPSLETEPGWNEGKGCALIEVADNIFQFSGVAGDEGDATIGTRIRISGWNLKFFHQNGWGGEFGGTDIEADTNSEELISISSDGNVTLKNELEKGATYVITLDITNGKTAAKVSLNKK